MPTIELNNCLTQNRFREKRGQGTGYRLVGQAEIITSGEFAELTKTKFPWARGALVIQVEKADQLQ